MNYSIRLERLRSELRRQKIDAILISNLSNIRYITGFIGDSAKVIISSDRACFYTDSRYQIAAHSLVSELYDISIGSINSVSICQEFIGDNLSNICAIEGEHISARVYIELQKVIPNVVVCSKLVENIRLIKDTDEIAHLEKASEILDGCFMAIQKLLYQGMTEIDLADALHGEMRNLGGEGLCFPTIVASGGRSALPHAIPTENTLEIGQLLTVDMGVYYSGYCSDATRTYCIGTSTDDQQNKYTAVWEAQAAAIHALKPGVRCNDLDGIAKNILQAYGFDTLFTHALGHGIGLDVHEQPTVSSKDTTLLKKGMIITCEPGIYDEKWGGIRIEDTLLVTDTGCRSLNSVAKPRVLPTLHLSRKD